MAQAPLWQPSPQAIKHSELTRFTKTVEAQHQIELPTYDALHQWSIKKPGEFWSSYWDFAHVTASHKGDTPVNGLDQFPGARWFPEAQLNFAENLLGERSDRIALVGILENGQRQTLTYNELHQQTADIAAGLKHLALQAGDRVAGWLPNINESVVAMLACASLGGTWSSCSPDFGIEGTLDRFGQIEPRVLFACNGYFYAGKTLNITEKVRAVASKIPSIERIIWVDVLDQPIKCQSNEVCYQDWLGQQNRLSFTQLPFNHPLYILYSSGTTGKPKCIVHGQGGTLLQHRKEHQLHLDLHAEDTLFFFTTCGWMMWNWLISALASRCRVVLYDGSPLHPGAGALFDLCQQENVSIFGISAKFLSSAQKQGICPQQTHQLNSMRMLISTGSVLTNEGFHYVYNHIKSDIHLVSMSGGTDIVSCFMLGNPNLPVYAGELQSPGLGMAVDIFNDAGKPITQGKGELVCTQPFPSCPLGFWQDNSQEKFRNAYFFRFPNIWVHGDFAERTKHGGYIIHGRSDAVLNPGGVRIGTAEIYRQLEPLDAVVDAVCVGQDWEDDVRVVLFVVMREGKVLDNALIATIKQRIRQHASPRHTPAIMIAVPDIPRTMSGKIAELAVRDIIHGRSVNNTAALANPEALNYFAGLPELA